MSRALSHSRMGSAVVLAAASSVLFAGATAAPAPAEPAEVIAAKRLIEAGRQEEAITILQTICRDRENDLAPHFYLAYCYGAIGRLEEARREYEACARCNPDRPEVHYNLGVILNKLGLHLNAARAFEEALLLNPGLEDANFNCGLSYYYADKPVQAIKFYREARALVPGDVGVLYWLALAYEEMDQRVALSIWEDYLGQAINVATEGPNLEFARSHVATLRAGKKP